MAGKRNVELRRIFNQRFFGSGERYPPVAAIMDNKEIKSPFCLMNPYL